MIIYTVIGLRARRICAVQTFFKDSEKALRKLLCKGKSVFECVINIFNRDLRPGTGTGMLNSLRKTRVETLHFS